MPRQGKGEYFDRYLYIADYGNHKVRRIDLNESPLNRGAFRTSSLEMLEASSRQLPEMALKGVVAMGSRPLKHNWTAPPVWPWICGWGQTSVCFLNYFEGKTEETDEKMKKNETDERLASLLPRNDMLWICHLAADLAVCRLTKMYVASDS